MTDTDTKQQTFDEWLAANPPSDNHRVCVDCVRGAWNARSDEIERLKSENERLRAYAPVGNEFDWQKGDAANSYSANIPSEPADIRKLVDLRPVDFHAECRSALQKMTEERDAARERAVQVLSTSICTKCGWMGAPDLFSVGPPTQWACGNKGCGYAVTPPKSAEIESLRSALQKMTEERSRLNCEGWTLGDRLRSAESELSKLRERVAELHDRADKDMASVASLRERLSEENIGKAADAVITGLIVAPFDTGAQAIYADAATSTLRRYFLSDDEGERS